MTSLPSLLRLLLILTPYYRPTRNALDAFQNRCLQRLIRHAHAHVPYYRNLFDANGVEPWRIRSKKDLQRIPITTREQLQNQDPGDLIDERLDPDKLIAAKTSGSSGKPLIVRRTWQEQLLLHGFLLRANRLMGLRFRDQVAGIGLARPYHPRDRKGFGKLLRRIGLFKNTRLSVNLEPEEILKRLVHIKPDVITGYPSVLNHIAGCMQGSHEAHIHPRFLMTGAEVLTSVQRQRIAAAFKAPVYDVYSSFEFHNIGWECLQTGLIHIADDAVVIEVAIDGRLAEPGEKGEIIGTALHSFAMPLIRYKLGDIVTQGHSHCTCGAPYAILQAIDGRVGDYLKLPGGRKVHALVFNQPIREKAPDWLTHYQVIQERRDLIIIKMVASRPPASDDLADLVAELSKLIDHSLPIEIRLVPEIALAPGAKQCAFVSKV